MDRILIGNTGSFAGDHGGVGAFSGDTVDRYQRAANTGMYISKPGANVFSCNASDLIFSTDDQSSGFLQVLERGTVEVGPGDEETVLWGDGVTQYKTGRILPAQTTVWTGVTAPHEDMTETPVMVQYWIVSGMGKHYGSAVFDCMGGYGTNSWDGDGVDVYGLPNGYNPHHTGEWEHGTRPAFWQYPRNHPYHLSNTVITNDPSSMFWAWWNGPDYADPNDTLYENHSDGIQYGGMQGSLGSEPVDPDLLNEEYDITASTEPDSQGRILLTEYVGGGGFCFVSGTKISMVDGTKKNIEDVVVNDNVISWNEETGKTGTSKVTKLIQPIHDDMAIFEWEHGTNINTFDHPYYCVSKKAWVSYSPQLTLNRYNFNEVNQLEVGDVGLSISKTGELIESTLLSIKENLGKVQTYIFELDTNNTFFANNILVHNKGGLPTGPGGIGDIGGGSGDGGGPVTGAAFGLASSGLGQLAASFSDVLSGAAFLPQFSFHFGSGGGGGGGRLPSYPRTQYATGLRMVGDMLYAQTWIDVIASEDVPYDYYSGFPLEAEDDDEKTGEVAIQFTNSNKDVTFSVGWVIYREPGAQ